MNHPQGLQMLSRLALSHARQRANQKLRASVVRQNIQRRSASGGLPPLTGAADNAFNRERRAVKAHAAKSSGMGLYTYGRAMKYES